MESETCKIVENAYRATLLAFMDEWSVFAERNGVDIIKVIQAIKMRPTHNNMLFPGPGMHRWLLPAQGRRPGRLGLSFPYHTCYSGAELIVRKLIEMGAEVSVHDPYVKHWWELEKQDTYPSPDHSMARFPATRKNFRTSAWNPTWPPPATAPMP